MSVPNTVGWLSFDVIACDAAMGAYVAMGLREALPRVTIRSDPDPDRSGGDALPHVLRCLASAEGLTSDGIRAAVEAVAASLCRVDDAGQPRMRLVFPETAAGSQAA